MNISPVRFVFLASISIFAFCWIFTIQNLVFHSKNNVVYPAPIYQNLHYQGESAGADFGQLYFSSKAWMGGESPYSTKNPAYVDALHRIPAYPPFTAILFSPLGKLEFSHALAVHLFIEIALYFVILFCLVKRGPLARGDAADLFFANAALLFFSPIGLTFLQQGQFDLYTATAYLLGGYLVITEESSLFSALGFFLLGVLISIKWTALPMLSFISLWEILVKRRWAIFLSWASVALTLLLQTKLSLEYFQVLQFWEARQMPAGISFHYLAPLLFLPGYSFVFIFICLSFLCCLFARKRKWQNEFFLFFAPLCIFSLGLGKMDFEYRSMALLGTLCIGLLQYRHRDWRDNPDFRLFFWLYCLFLLIAMRTFPFQAVDETLLALLYFMSSLGLFCFAWKISTKANIAKVAA